MTSTQAIIRRKTSGTCMQKVIKLLRVIIPLGIVVILLAVSVAGYLEARYMDRFWVEYQHVEQPSMELIELRQQEYETLNSYAELDADEGLYRIPIQRAMELMVEEAE